MATQTWAGASFAGGEVTASITFDDVTLLVAAAQFTNTSPQAAAAHVTGPAGFNQTFVWPANAGTGGTSLAGAALHMVATSRPAEKGLPARTVYNLPTGWAIEFQYPAS